MGNAASSPPSLVFKSSSSIPEKILCATNVVGERVALGTTEGRVYEFNTKTNTATLLHDFHPNEHLPMNNRGFSGAFVSVNPEGDTALFNSYNSKNAYLFNLRTKASAEFSKFKDLNADPINASCAYTDDEIAYAASDSFMKSNPTISKTYARMLCISDGKTKNIGQFKVCDSNDDVYCEVIKKYTGPETAYFKPGEMYGQFRKWEKDKGYIHRITHDTSKETAYVYPLEEEVVPLIFDFVPGKAQMVCVHNDGSVRLICLQTNTVLTVWEKIKLPSKMPGVCASQSHAFVDGNAGVGYLLNLATHGENIRLPSSISGNCAKSLDGSQLVLFTETSREILEEAMIQEEGAVGETRSVYDRTWIWTEGDVPGGAAWVDITANVSLRGGAARLKQVVLNHESVHGRDLEARRAVNRLVVAQLKHR